MLNLSKLGRRFSTVNPDEMVLFKSLTNWWHPSGPMHMLYAYNYHRINFLRKHVGEVENFRIPFNNMKALDVGCGAGFLSESMARLGASVTALDPNPTSFNEAVAHQNLKRDLKSLQYINCSVEEYINSEKGKENIG